MKDLPISLGRKRIFRFVSIRNVESLPPFPRYLFYTVFAQQREINHAKYKRRGKNFFVSRSLPFSVFFRERRRVANVYNLRFLKSLLVSRVIFFHAAAVFCLCGKIGQV